MTEKDIDKHFRGYKWHHFLVYCPTGMLFTKGLMEKQPVLWISALMILVGGWLQGRYFFTGMKKFVQFLKEQLQNN